MTAHAVVAQLKHHVHILLVLEAIFEADDVRVSQHLVQFDLGP
jgi:hypothetical protein